MSEQEYIHEYEWEHEQMGSFPDADTSNENIEIQDLDESEGRVLARWPVRLLVVALLASFLLCLTALWFSGTLLSVPDQLLPISFLQMIADHRLFVLLVPAACLVICYGVLRAFTREIMAVPERYLDERQKMLRDQAHRSAFKIIKFACLLIPCGFLLPHLPWFNRPVATGFTPLMVIWEAPQAQIDAKPALTLSWRPFYSLLSQGQIPGLTVVPATTAEMVLAGVLFVLCLLLIVSALPMAVLAWKGRR